MAATKAKLIVEDRDDTKARRPTEKWTEIVIWAIVEVDTIDEDD
jgi:hypothetical protein